MCLDSASDNYVTHNFLRSLNITPIIDINYRKKDKNPFASFNDDLNSDNIPVCLNNNPMICDGYEEKKQ